MPVAEDEAVAGTVTKDDLAACIGEEGVHIDWSDEGGV